MPQSTANHPRRGRASSARHARRNTTVRAKRTAGAASRALRAELEQIAVRARAAAGVLATASTAAKNAALNDIASDLLEAAPALLEANALDLAAAERAGLAPAMLDRLRLTAERLAAMSVGVAKVAALPDPVGEVIREWRRSNGLLIRKRRVPIGVVGIIYEARPNVTADAAALCLKSGNAAVLRGGSEAFRTSSAIAAVMERALARHGFSGAAALVPTTDRAAVPVLCALEKHIDVMVPRGGHGLISTVVRHARMPVIKHYNGICHVFVHRDADPAMAEKIILNAKCQRPGVCNAAETLLVDAAIAPTFIPRAAAALAAAGVEIRACPLARKLAPAGVEFRAATAADWDTEHLALILNLRVVPDLAGALAHIAAHGSQHSDAIVTGNAAAAEEFLNAVDSAAVYWNASTRFTDGGEFGFGAELGISTQKLHARGPMGLDALTTIKYRVTGSGQVRA